MDPHSPQHRLRSLLISRLHYVSSMYLFFVRSIGHGRSRGVQRDARAVHEKRRRFHDCLFGHRPEQFQKRS